jgi:NarL family two-component system response regulator YdfI
VTQPSRSTIVVAADSPLAAARIEALLREASTAPVVIANPGQIATAATEHAPCIVILSMPAPSVARALERLAIAPPMPPVIVLTTAPHEAWTARARRNGVRAVLRQDAGADELTAAIRATQAGLLTIHPDALHGAPTPVTAAPAAAAVALTAREIEVLEMMAEGMSNRAIARHLKISSHTVKFHVASVLGKLGARTRTEAVTAGIRHGLISL